MSAFEEMFGDYLNAYKNTSQYRDNSMLGIALRKSEFEKNQKDTYDMDDIINVHRKSGNFKGNHTCGLSNIPNGKTTAFQNA